MLNSVLKDAIKKRDETLSILKGPKFEQIVKEAKSNWVDFSPTKQDVVAAGIDSSFNSTKFQGAELWAVTAVSVKSDGEILVEDYPSSGNLGFSANRFLTCFIVTHAAILTSIQSTRPYGRASTQYGTLPYQKR